MKLHAWLAKVALLWAGIVVGCSFIATPAKFKAPSLSLPTALEVGRATFRSMVLAELILVVAGVVLLVQMRSRRSWFWLAIAILAIQWLGVMPMLNARTDAVIAGTSTSGPPWHLAYILLEVIKVAALLLTAFSKNAALPTSCTQA